MCYLGSIYIWLDTVFALPRRAQSPGAVLMGFSTTCLLLSAILFSVTGCCTLGPLPGVDTSISSSCCVERNRSLAPPPSASCCGGVPQPHSRSQKAKVKQGVTLGRASVLHLFLLHKQRVRAKTFQLLLLQSAHHIFTAIHPKIEHATREVTTHVAVMLLSSIQNPRLVSSSPPRTGNPHVFHS